MPYTYWKITDKNKKAQAKELLAKWPEVIKNAEKLARSVGAVYKDFLCHYSSGTYRIAGFFFRRPPDKNLWKLLHTNKLGKAYEPTKKNLNYLNFKTLYSDADYLLEKCFLKQGALLTLTVVDDSFVIERAKFEVYGREVYILWPHKSKPKHCEQVSDIAFNKIVARTTRRAKRKPLATNKK